MDTLPRELISYILDDVVDKKDYLSLRVVCSILRDITTPRALRVLNISPQEDGHVSILSILNAPHLSKHVREINLRAQGGSSEIQDNNNKRNQAYTEVSFSDKAIADTSSWLNRMADFAGLQSLNLYFPNTYQEPAPYVDDEPSSVFTLQTAVFERLFRSSHIPTLTSLNIHNLIARPNAGIRLLLSTDSEESRSVIDPSATLDDGPDSLVANNSISKIAKKTLSSLKSLCIKLLSDTDSEEGYYDELFLDFWEIDVPLLLKAPCTTLTSLAILSDMQGPCLSVNFWKTAFYPNLSQLHVDGIMFHSDNFGGEGSSTTGIEYFAMNHQSTLQHMKLTNCTLDREEGQDRTWAQVWTVLRKHLTCLKTFYFHPLPGPIQDDDTYDAYSDLLIGSGYIAISLEEAPPRDADMQAFDELQNDITRRSAIKLSSS